MNSIPEIYHSGEGPIGDSLGPRAGWQPSDRLNIHEIVSIFNRRIALFAIVAFIVFELAQAITFAMPRVYSATAQIALDRISEQVAPKGSSVVDADQSSSDVDTQVQVLTSRELAGKVVDAQGLAKDPTFLPPKFHGDRQQASIDRLINNLDVERVKTAFVITLSYQDTDPVRAARVANAVAETYSQQQVSGQRSANSKAATFLSAQIGRLRDQAQNDMRALQEYRVANNLLSTTGATLTEQEISSYNQQVAQARAQAIEDSARLSTAKKQLLISASGADIGQSLSSPVIQGLRQQRATISAHVADLSTRYGPKYPELADARSQLRDIDLQIQTEVLRELSSLDAQARVSAQRLASLQSSLGGARSALAQNNRAMVDLDDLQRRATTSQELYQSYLDRYKTVAAQAGTEAPNARVLSEAKVPGAPSSPRVVLNLALGLLMGLMLGAAAAIAAELYFTGFTTGDEIERRLGLPYLGGVPALKSIEPREATPLATVEQFPRSGFAESFRLILASVRHGRDTRHGVIAVTSALPGEGKSTLAVCLAAASAIGTNDRVVAIDLDVTRHRLSDLTIKNRTKPGLREVLREGKPIEDALVQIAGSNLYVLPVTTEFEKKEQITRGGLVHTLVTKLREHFSLVILDCPPLLPVAEARDLVALADDVVLVAAWRKTTESALRGAIRMLSPLAVAKTGIALTKINMKKQARFGAGDPTAFYKKYRQYYST
jgi:uncharacterized protein involved in exopolysaccharide biosynthesis/MinD-like ATPase involved in chromosome partitioning or flagellar assembly